MITRVEYRMPSIRFALSAPPAASPAIVSAAADEDFWWQGPGGSFVGKAPAVGNFVAGDYLLRSRSWELVTGVRFDSKNMTRLDGVRRVLTRTGANFYLYAYANAGLVCDISDWGFMPNLTNVRLYSTLITGDVGKLVLSANATTIYLQSCNLYGDLSLMGTLPPTATQFYIFSTSVTYGTGGFFATATRDASSYLTYSCGWTQAMVDRQLADCVASGTFNSTLQTHGTNASPTGGAGNADYLTLLARGWTVLITP